MTAVRKLSKLRTKPRTIRLRNIAQLWLVLYRAVRMQPGDERRSGRPCAGVGGPHRCCDKPVVGGEVADGVGSGRVARQLKCLAAASAEIDLAAVAAPAWVRHPACSAEALEEGGPLPDPCQGVLAQDRKSTRLNSSHRTIS